MKTFSDIRMLHIEISSKCNARCPGCPRNFFGYPFNGGFVEHDMTLPEFQQILSLEFLKQIDEIWFNGNRGDFIMNPWGVDIVNYVRQSNPRTDIKISTNGSARNRDYWRKLGQQQVSVFFCLDGLEDTHSIYRQDTNFQTILENAKTFMASGGKAFWQFTVFEHNRHQIEEARATAQSLGFTDFVSRPNARMDCPVYNRQGQKIFHLGKSNPRSLPEQIDENYIKRYFKNMQFNKAEQKIRCESVEMKSLYVGATGSVTPCCYMDLPQPQNTYGKVAKLDSVTAGILEKDQSTAADRKYFPLIQQSWSSTPSGVCKNFCGEPT